MRYVIALGGNALLRRSERPDAAVQRDHVRVAARQLAPLMAGNEVILCHGNGPQIGMLALESGNDAELSTPFPLDTLGAQTQGMIGYWLAQELGNAGVTAPIAVVLTQTLVSAADPAFARPTKFIGPTYTRAQATDLRAQHGWQVAPDTSGWRRVVASPEPRAVVELPLIQQLTAAGNIVICAGGGGVPVVHSDNARRGVEAVVDKDLTAALLAVELQVDRFIVLTDTDAVKIGFGTASEASLDIAYADELDGMSFPAGSMGPKIEACSRFVTRTGRPAHIGALEHAAAVVAGRSGTTVRARAVPAQRPVRHNSRPPGTTAEAVNGFVRVESVPRH